MLNHIYFCTIKSKAIKGKVNIKPPAVASLSDSPDSENQTKERATFRDVLRLKRNTDSLKKSMFFSFIRSLHLLSG